MKTTNEYKNDTFYGKMFGKILKGRLSHINFLLELSIQPHIF